MNISVVIPHYGDAGPTQALIESLLAQDDSPDLQVIVSDDASPQPFPDGPGYQVVRAETNGGFGAAVNLGARLARHEALLILNSDVLVTSRFVSELSAGAAPWWPAVVSTTVRNGVHEQCVPRTWPTVRQQAVEELVPLARFHGTDRLERAIGNDVTAWRSPDPQLVDWAVGVCLLMPTRCFAAVGGFDPRFYMNCEEIDLQRRLHALLGLPVVVLPEPVIEHAGGGSSDPQRRAGWVTDARMRYHAKWVGGPGLYAALSAVNAVNLAWQSARSVAGRPVDARGAFVRRRHQLKHAWVTRSGGAR